MISAILFDLDGTLIDTAPDFVVTVNELLSRYNKPALAEELIRNRVSDGASALIKLAFKIDEQSTDFLAKRQELLALYTEHLGKHSSLFPGMSDLLNTLKQHAIAWGIVTNKPECFTTPLVNSLLASYPPLSVICPDHVSLSKPSPEGLLLACEQMDCDARRAIYVGDHKRDIDSGVAAGMKTIAVTFGYIKPDDNIKQWPADYWVDHAQEIWPIVEQTAKQHCI